MGHKYGTLSGSLLTLIGDATGFFTWPLPYTEGWRRKQLKSYKNKELYDRIHYLKHKGLIKETDKNGIRFFELTKKGQLETLFIKSRLPASKVASWDGKWRLVIFDIPEDARNKRDKLRRLLKERGFVKLQASVFISPYELNRAAIDYLKQTGLMDFIRIGRIDEFDDDKDLKKKFKLT